jgi:glyoxylase-like metal-dependent hydrolase (beta-lactamase superfamily II)
MKLAAIFAAVAVAAVVAEAVAQQPTPPPPQQPDFSKAEVKVTDLGHKTFMLEGVGGNITVAAGDDAVIMIDAQFAPMHDKIKAAVDAATKLPIRYVVNTHFHGDHTGGNAGFAADGAVVTAQVNVRKRLAEGTISGLTGAKIAPVTGAGLPTNVYTDTMTLKIAGRSADLHYIANAHTDGDTYVYWTEANVLSTGDTMSTGRYPNIDVANGGNIKGMIEACDRYLELVDDQTKIVPGHGFLATKADLVAYRAMLVDARDRMTKLIADGKSEADVIAAKPFTDYDQKLGATNQASQNFIRVVYRSLKGRGFRGE